MENNEEILHMLVMSAKLYLNYLILIFLKIKKI